VTGSYKLAFFTEERRVVDREEHVHGRLIDRDPWNASGFSGSANSISDFEIFDAGYSANITCCNFRNFDLPSPSNTCNSFTFTF
jgi:hypothetical protein